MADGQFPGLVSKSRDVNSVTNPIFVELSDGSSAVSLTGTSLDVNITGGSLTVTLNSEFQVDDAAGATDFGENILVVRDDALTTLTPVDGDYVSLRVDSVGALWTDISNSWASETGGGTEAGVLRVTIANDSTGLISVDDNGGSLTVDFLGQYVDDAAFTVAVDTVVAVGMMADETAPDSVDEGDIGIPRMTLDRKQLMVIVDPSTDSRRLGVNIDGSINVNIVESIISGEIHNYDTSANVAADTADNHDYPVTGGKTLLLNSVIFSASGSIKAEIQVGPLATLATIAVGFLQGHQGDTKQVFFDPPVEVPSTSTGTVRVIRTNRQGATMDVYSTIIGREV